MSKNLLCSIKKESLEEDTTPVPAGMVCTSSALGELLPDYIAELLADSIEEAVEDHLLDCLHCREKYQKVLSISNSLRSVKAVRSTEADQELVDECGTGGATVLQIAEFREAQS